jgi:hypothetical protein
MSGADQLSHLIKQAASQEINGIKTSFRGHIANYDPVLHRVRVIFPAYRDSSGTPVLSSWMPLGSMWVGNGYGIQIAPFTGASLANPTGGSPCVVEFQERSTGVSATVTLCFNQTVLPPDPTMVEGEMLIKAPDGTSIKFTHDHQILLNAPQQIVETAATTVAIEAPTASASGNFSVGTGATGSFTTPTGLTVLVQDGIVTNIY